MAMIHEAICRIMADVPAIGKDRENLKQKFKYRGIDDVQNVFNPLLAKHGVFLVPEVLDTIREERQSINGGNLIYSVLKVRYTFYAQDGSNVSAVVQGEGMDSGDKSSNKAMSAAYKYVMFQTFSIPTEEMQDPDAETPPASKPAKKSAEQKREDMEQFYRDEAAKLVNNIGQDDEYAVCENCGGYIYKQPKKDGTVMGVHEYLIACLKAYGKPLCKHCRKEAQTA